MAEQDFLNRTLKHAARKLEELLELNPELIGAAVIFIWPPGLDEHLHPGLYLIRNDDKESFGMLGVQLGRFSTLYYADMLNRLKIKEFQEDEKSVRDSDRRD